MGPSDRSKLDLGALEMAGLIAGMGDYLSQPNSRAYGVERNVSSGMSNKKRAHRNSKKKMAKASRRKNR